MCCSSISVATSCLRRKGTESNSEEKQNWIYCRLKHFNETIFRLRHYISTGSQRILNPLLLRRMLTFLTDTQTNKTTSIMICENAADTTTTPIILKNPSDNSSSDSSDGFQNNHNGLTAILKDLVKEVEGITNQDHPDKIHGVLQELDFILWKHQMEKNRFHEEMLEQLEKRKTNDGTATASANSLSTFLLVGSRSFLPPPPHLLLAHTTPTTVTSSTNRGVADNTTNDDDVARMTVLQNLNGIEFWNQFDEMISQEFNSIEVSFFQQQQHPPPHDSYSSPQRLLQQNRSLSSWPLDEKDELSFVKHHDHDETTTSASSKEKEEEERFTADEVLDKLLLSPSTLSTPSTNQIVKEEEGDDDGDDDDDDDEQQQQSLMTTRKDNDNIDNYDDDDENSVPHSVSTTTSSMMVNVRLPLSSKKGDDSNSIDDDGGKGSRKYIAFSPNNTRTVRDTTGYTTFHCDNDNEEDQRDDDDDYDCDSKISTFDGACAAAAPPAAEGGEDDGDNDGNSRRDVHSLISAIDHLLATSPSILRTDCPLEEEDDEEINDGCEFISTCATHGSDAEINVADLSETDWAQPISIPENGGTTDKGEFEYLHRSSSVEVQREEMKSRKPDNESVIKNCNNTDASNSRRSSSSNLLPQSPPPPPPGNPPSKRRRQRRKQGQSYPRLKVDSSSSSSTDDSSGHRIMDMRCEDHDDRSGTVGKNRDSFSSSMTRENLMIDNNDVRSSNEEKQEFNNETETVGFLPRSPSCPELPQPPSLSDDDGNDNDKNQVECSNKEEDILYSVYSISTHNVWSRNYMEEETLSSCLVPPNKNDVVLINSTTSFDSNNQKDESNAKDDRGFKHTRVEGGTVHKEESNQIASKGRTLPEKTTTGEDSMQREEDKLDEQKQLGDGGEQFGESMLAGDDCKSTEKEETEERKEKNVKSERDNNDRRLDVKKELDDLEEADKQRGQNSSYNYHKRSLDGTEEEEYMAFPRTNSKDSSFSSPLDAPEISDAVENILQVSNDEDGHPPETPSSCSPQGTARIDIHVSLDLAEDARHEEENVSNSRNCKGILSAPPEEVSPMNSMSTGSQSQVGLSVVSSTDEDRDDGGSLFCFCASRPEEHPIQTIVSADPEDQNLQGGLQQLHKRICAEASEHIQPIQESLSMVSDKLFPIVQHYGDMIRTTPNTYNAQHPDYPDNPDEAVQSKAIE